MRSETGRLSRRCYWALVISAYAIKAAVAHYLGILAVFGLMIAVFYLLIAARLHDFGGPTWLARLLAALIIAPGIVWGITLVLTGAPAGQFPSVQELLAQSPWLALLLLAPEPLILLVVGSVPGHATRNVYGPPYQGVLGILPRSAEEDSGMHTDPIAYRMQSIMVGQSREAAPQQTMRPMSPTFGRR